MNKNHYKIIIVTFLIFAFTACGNAGVDSSSVGNESISENATESVKSESNETASAQANDIIKKYQSLYNAKATYQDKLVPIDFLLVSDTQIIKVRAIEGAESTSIIAIDQIAKTNTSEVANMNTLTFTDKSGGEIKIVVSLNDAKEILEMIK